MYGPTTSSKRVEAGVFDGRVSAPRSVRVVHPLNVKRRAILTEIDNATFSWFHVKVAFVSGAGFFTDAYDIFAINIVSVMLGFLYGSGGDSDFSKLSSRTLSTSQEIGIKIATPAGVLFGQLLFGWLGDLLGRKRIYGMELMLIIVATFGQTLCAPAIGVSMMGVLIFWRLMMGIGIGGDYPISAVISSEFSSVYIRGRVMTAVFANQGWGSSVTATLFSFIIVSAYKRSFMDNDPSSVLHSLDQIWRLVIGLGCIPGAIALYFRLTIPETPRFTMDIERNILKAGRDLSALLDESEAYTVDPDALNQRVIARQATQHDFRSYFSKWENLKILIGTAYSWFALDIAFYGLGLNSSVILGAIGFGSPKKGLAPGPAIYQTLHNASLGNVILSLAGLVPGYWATFIFIDRWGRKPIQFMGFGVLTIIFLIMGFAYNKMNATESGRGAFVFLYCLANFFQNFGPNTTTFIVPGEVFPTRYRATAHGISAASGKFGAVIAQLAFQWLKDVGGPNQFLNHILEIFAFFMLTGVFSTMLIPETNQKTLEFLSNEDQDDFIQPVPRQQPGSPYNTGYLNEFQSSPIKLHVFESDPGSPGSMERPPTAYSSRGRRKGTTVSMSSHEYLVTRSPSEFSVAS
ncbi:inorganic phosphate transporter [Lenzites betulinus]|nr:inorganic phosphate transporter [Lenzites betulinus]